MKVYLLVYINVCTYIKMHIFLEAIEVKRNLNQKHE